MFWREHVCWTEDLASLEQRIFLSLSLRARCVNCARVALVVSCQETNGIAASRRNSLRQVSERNLLCDSTKEIKAVLLSLQAYSRSPRLLLFWSYRRFRASYILAARRCKSKHKKDSVGAREKHSRHHIQLEIRRGLLLLIGRRCSI